MCQEREEARTYVYYSTKHNFDRSANDKWTTATSLEMVQMDEYDIFIDKGEFDNSKIPEGFKKIRVHLIFAVKHDVCHKVCLVADGHITDVPLNSVYCILRSSITKRTTHVRFPSQA